MIKDHRLVCLKILPYTIVLSICWYVIYRLNNIDYVSKNIDCDFFWSGKILYEKSGVIIYYGTHLTDVIRTTWEDIGVYTTKTWAIYDSFCDKNPQSYDEQISDFICQSRWEC
jgi:hypothetical protein